MKHTYFTHSLKSKVFLRCTILMGIALIATSIFSVSLARNMMRDRTIDELLSRSNGQAESIQRRINANRTTARLLATDVHVVNASLANRGTVRNSLIRKMDLLPELHSIAILDPFGTILIATDSSMEGGNLSDLPHVMRGRQVTTVSPLNIVQGSRTALVATPIRNQTGQLKGILLVEFKLEEMLSILSHAKHLGKTSEYLLLEPETHGGFCTNPSQSVFSQKGTLSEMLQAITGGTLTYQHATVGSVPSQGRASLLCSLAASGREGILEAQDADDRLVLASHRHLQDIGLGIIMKVDAGEVLEPVRLLMVALIGTTGILLLLFALVSFRLSQEIVEPILALKKSLGTLNTGHFTHKRSIFTGDELETLDAEVARLAVRLEEAYSSLEEKILERTEDLHEQHAKDEALLHSIAEGVLAIDLDGKVVTSNKAAEEMLQWNEEQIQGAHFSELLQLRTKAGKPLPPKQHFVEQALRDKLTVRTPAAETHLCMKQDGSNFPISLTATPFLIGLEARGVVVTFRDITEEKRIDRMKSEFISLASHQLRTPLTAIGWYVELFQNESTKLTDDQQDYITQIISSHRRMVDLVNALLNVSRIELGRLKIEPEKVSVETIIGEIVRELQPLMEEKNITYTQELPQKLTALIDPQLVRMVLENLLSNAIKYTPKDGSIELIAIADKKEMRFSVKDTGLGIPKSQQQRIFEKLFRADNVQKTDTEGTGIGLYIAKYTAEAWGGRLWFESEEGKGSTFYITIPLKMKKIAKQNGHSAESVS